LVAGKRSHQLYILNCSYVLYWYNPCVTTIVAIDLETTGLDPKKDAIIEIGAVRFNGAQIEAEWSTLVNPGRPIPPFITQLTGIHDEDVMRQPFLQEVYPDLLDFVGETPVLGHNVRFDLGFLKQRGGLLRNQAIDTYELAAVLLPTYERYNLGALSEALGIVLPEAHRALDDARATREVYLELCKMTEQLPVALLAEIVQMAEPLEWMGLLPFREALRQLSGKPLPARRVADSGGELGPLFRQGKARRQAALQPKETLEPLDIEEAAALIERGDLHQYHQPAGPADQQGYSRPAGCSWHRYPGYRVKRPGQLPVPAPAGKPAPARPGDGGRNESAGQSAGLAAGHRDRRSRRDQPEWPIRARSLAADLSR
jgi:DNA polymerase III epsilon subunit family exonuclease